MMKKESLKLTGRVVSVNTADQSVLLESTESPNRFRVYANNKLFKRIEHTLTISWFNGGKTRKITTGTFHIQGKVLMGFIKGERKPLAERYPKLTALVNQEFPE
ncbi:MAG: hypothetical protein LBG57_09620 [Treponema sp.]|jgi:hypothetical protein|nr:hypothetical protein [Treponema sp.]